MSLAAIVGAATRSVRPEPGRPAGPGQQMPVYQGVPGARWDGAAKGLANAPRPRVIKTHVNFPSNSKIVQSFVTTPWREGDHEYIHEGQYVWCKRTRGPPVENKQMFDDQTTLVNTQHLNDIFREGFARARKAVETGNLPSGVTLTKDQFDAISEQTIMDWMGSPARELELAQLIEKTPEGLVQQDLLQIQQAIKLVKISPFHYLYPGTAQMVWNPIGGVNNVSWPTGPANRMDRNTPRTPVVNTVMAKQVFLSNVWGDARRLTEGAKIGWIVNRKDGKNADRVSHPQILPWAEMDRETPAMCDRGYLDNRGREQLGYFHYVGTCSEIDGLVPAEQKRRQAIGNLGQTKATVFDALGTLPKISVQIGV